MKGKENRGAKYEESIRQIYGEKETVVSIHYICYITYIGVPKAGERNQFYSLLCNLSNCLPIQVKELHLSWHPMQPVYV